MAGSVWVPLVAFVPVHPPVAVQLVTPVLDQVIVGVTDSIPEVGVTVMVTDAAHSGAHSMASIST
jgi:hypothetical protein